MLIKEFYKIISLSSDEFGINSTIKLNQDHEVYKGHFPEQPIVPGVIQLQIVKEILESHLQKKLFMGNVIQVKYLIPITPLEWMELVKIELPVPDPHPIPFPSLKAIRLPLLGWIPPMILSSALPLFGYL